MSKEAFINVRIERSLKTKTDKILKKIGVSPSQAVSMFYRQIVFYKGIPFDMRIPNAETVAAFKELESGGGELFHGTADELFAKLSEDDPAARKSS